MKDNKIDILFKKKLYDLEKSPRPVAWDKINSQMTKEKASISWWYKAAIIVLLCLSGLLIFNKKNDSDNKQLKVVSNLRDENTIEKIQEKTIEKESPSIDKYSNIPHITKRPADALKEEESIPSKPKANKRIAKVTKDIIKEDNALPAPEQNKYEDKESSSYQSTLSSIAEASSFKEKSVLIKDTPPITIEFKSRKRKIEKAMLADNNSENITEEHASTLKKFMWKVKDIKESEISLADLRQAKDNLFALDTYKETFKSTDK